MLLIALVLHGGVAMWFSVSKPEPPPLPPKQAIRINLLAAVSETKVDTPVALPELSPTVAQAPERVPEVAPEPIPEPEPEVPEFTPEPVLAPEPIPEPIFPEPLPIESVPDPLPEPELQEPLVEPELPRIPIPEPPPLEVPEPEPAIQAAVPEQESLEEPLPEPPPAEPKMPASKIEATPKPALQEIMPEPPEVLALAVQETPPPEQIDESVVEQVAETGPVEEVVEQASVKATTGSSDVPEDTLADALATAQYEKALVSWLKKHKKYPRRARRLRIEGEGVLLIRIDRKGRIQRVTLEQSTGNRLLDKAALEIARRADPFPPMPPHDLRQEMAFFVPVVFALR